jgi:hypothetical protein
MAGRAVPVRIPGEGRPEARAKAEDNAKKKLKRLKPTYSLPHLMHL